MALAGSCPAARMFNSSARLQADRAQVVPRRLISVCRVSSILTIGTMSRLSRRLEVAKRFDLWKIVGVGKKARYYETRGNFEKYIKQFCKREYLRRKIQAFQFTSEGWQEIPVWMIE